MLKFPILRIGKTYKTLTYFSNRGFQAFFNFISFHYRSWGTSYRTVKNYVDILAKKKAKIFIPLNMQG